MHIRISQIRPAQTVCADNFDFYTEADDSGKYNLIRDLDLIKQQNNNYHLLN